MVMARVVKEAENDGKGNALVTVHGPYERVSVVSRCVLKYAQ